MLLLKSKLVLVVTKPRAAAPTAPAAEPAPKREADAATGVTDAQVAAVASRAALARSEHAASVDRVRHALDEHGLQTHFVATGETQAPWGEADLVVTVGGDGTFLWAARHCNRVVPVLGVNSSPSTSEGFYCTVAPAAFPTQLVEALEGRAPTRRLHRLRANIDGRALPYMALNDVLLANTSPVAASRYAIAVGDRGEIQLSSGVWVCTSTGASGAVRSAGGVAMSHDDPRLQYVVREPFRGKHHAPELLQGVVAGPITLISRSDHNAVYLDGQKHGYPATRGATIELAVVKDDLQTYQPV